MATDKLSATFFTAKIPERTPESYQVDDGYHDNQYESISVAKQQQPSVASGDNTYATM